MSSAKLEETVKKLEKRITDLEAEFSEIKDHDTLTEEELHRRKEVDKWVKSGNLNKLIKVK